MSHHIYQTNAFVLGSSDLGEANKTLLLFTEELGVLYAVAQGIRLQKSKLKASLQDFSYIRVCLVKGKEVWRLTSAEKLISLYDKRLSLEARKALAGILRFVQRMSPGEGKQKDLFEILTKLCAYVFQNKIDLAKIHLISVVAKFKILHVLGYGSGNDELVKRYQGSEWNDALIEGASKDEEALNRHNETALRESHL
ncbi:MAG TPA: DNA repair protein RecO [Candidatus Paceibacterota bacterium]